MKVVLDIETVQTSREEWARLAGLELCTVEPEDAEDLFTRTEMDERRKSQDELYEKSSFDGTYSRIICIGLIAFSDAMEPQGAISWYGPNEKELLQKFWGKMGQLRPTLV